MNLDTMVAAARAANASDIHLEGGLPMALRVHGELQLSGDPVPPSSLTALARELIDDDDDWSQLISRGSADLSRTIVGVRCRINILRSARGIGLAIRLLAAFQATVKTLNLHADIKKLVAQRHGLIMVSGPTGSGKSSTVAALVQEINMNEARHIVTVESPIEHVIHPRMSLIRQREVGRDTPSFEQALIDAMREDPDVIVVGEMRDPETMRLTLNAAETGHLVLTTVHSSTTAEAVARVVSAFPAESQSSIAAQLADCLVGVVCQRLRYRPDIAMRVPECEVMMPSTGVRATIRAQQFSKLGNAIEGGAAEGHWTWARYRNWLDARTDWVTPQAPAAHVVDSPPHHPPPRHLSLPSTTKANVTLPAAAPPRSRSASGAPVKASAPMVVTRPVADEGDEGGVHVIEDIADDPATVLEQLRRRS